MKFNLVYGNHSYEGLHISDTLRLIKYSLQSIGHTVAISPRMEPGQNNIIIENFTYDFIVTMENLRKVEGTRFIILATEYISDNDRFNYFPDSSINDNTHYAQDSLWQKRWKTFCLAVKSCDAIWHLSEPQVSAYQRYFPDVPVGYLPHAYLSDLIRVNPVPDIQKDIDVLFTGTMTPYRQSIIDKLEQSGLIVKHGAVNTPDHIREDWVSRSRLAINLRQNSQWSYPSNSRFFYHIMNSSLLLTQECDEACDLDNYVLHANAEAFETKVHEILAGNTTELASQILREFKNNRPMEPLITALVKQTFNVDN